MNRLKTIKVALLTGAVVLVQMQIRAQSYALNGQIDGTVSDQNSAPIANAFITAVHVESGLVRTAVSNENGRLRLPILPAGTFRITVEAAGFKRSIQQGVTLATGQTAVINFVLQIGDISESVTISADASVPDQGKIEMGRVMNEREVHDLPLYTLNPYNFVFLQSNVTGNRTAIPGLGFPNVHANGFSRRGNYQIDGNYATDVTMGGVRMLFLSRMFIKEVQLTTSGMSAEFGTTVGHVMNVVTPSGTNAHSGSLSYQLRRSGFAAQRFNVAPGSRKVDPTADVFSAVVGGPVRKDRWHYYAGFEAFRWDLRSASRVITVSEANRQALIAAGVPASAMPATFDAPETYRYYIGRTDLQLNERHRIALRFLASEGVSEKIGVGSAPGNTLQLTQDYRLIDTSLAGQLISMLSGVSNELRVQFSRRETTPRRNEHTGTGEVSIRIPGIAAFGSPPDRLGNAEDRALRTLQNNLSVSKGSHSIKIGGGLAAHRGKQFSDPSAEYRFASIQDYVDSVTGVNPRAYSRYTDTFGDPSAATDASFWNGFVQDEWAVNRRLRINAGLRYDVFILPSADPSSPYPATRAFKVDKNNFGPRLGFAYVFGSADRPMLMRGSAGVYYDPPILNYYSRALRDNGNASSFSFSFGPESGPNFPHRFQSFPPGSELPIPDIEAIDPNFKTMSAVHVNLQFEKAFGDDIAFTAAYSHSSGRHIPTARQTNCRPTGQTLADGRPIYGSILVNPNGSVLIAPCVDPILPQFANVWVWESVGNLNYNALALKLTKRYSSGYQFSLNYTLARSVDDAAEENIAVSAQWQSDPSNRRHDRSLSLSDQRHTLASSFVIRPSIGAKNKVLNNLLNNNQFAFIVRVSNGERQNLLVNIDLNRNDGTLMDRPVGVSRNFLKTPPFFNADLRYSRHFELADRFRVELFADISNLTNTNSIVSYTNATLTANNINDAQVDPFTGELRGPLPDFRALGVTSTDSRRIQLGLKFHF